MTETRRITFRLTLIIIPIVNQRKVLVIWSINQSTKTI